MPVGDQHGVVRSRGPDAARGTSRRGLWVLVVASVVLVAVYVFVAEPMRVPSSSMRPTLLPGDHVLVDKLTYRLRAPRRWELVVFSRPGGGLALKRVVGLPGDRVGLRDGVLVVGNHRVEEGYVDYESVDGTFFGPVRVPPGRVFLLGDRRANSEDSRDFGAVPVQRVVGRAVFVVWPLDRAGAVPAGPGTDG